MTIKEEQKDERVKKLEINIGLDEPYQLPEMKQLGMITFE